MYHQTLLPNGARIVTAEMPHMASASVGFWVGSGGRCEEAGVAGISHFIEHLLFKGTRTRSAARISEAVEGIGGYLNAFTDEEHTCFYARAHANRWPELVDVLGDMFLNSKLAPADIERERAVILEELAMYRDQPAELVHDLLNQVQFPRHPLGRPVIGIPATLRRLQRSDFLQYLDRNYTSGATVIAAAGNLAHADFVRVVAPIANRIRPGPRPAFTPFVRPNPAPALKWMVRKVEQANLGLGLRTTSRHDPRRHALRLLSVILGENMSSRLFQSIRERHGLTYNIQSSLTLWADTGDLVISAGLDASEIERTLQLILLELRKLERKPPAPDELQRARDYLLGQFDLSLESTENHMMWLGEQWLNLGEFHPPASVRQHIASVTAEDLRKVARDFLTPDRRSLAVVAPRKQGRRIASLLMG